MLCRKPSVLIVDDLPEIRIPFVIILRRLGFSVRHAADGFSALLDMRVEQPDILVCGLKMKGMSGLELLSIVRRRYSETLVIATSDSYLDASLQAGVPADAYHATANGPNHLVELVQQFTQSRPTCAMRDCVPTWIDEEAQTVSAKGQVVILCPECLRVTAAPVSDGISPFRKAVCLHCANLISYALVPPSELLLLIRPQLEGEIELKPSLEAYVQ